MLNTVNETRGRGQSAWRKSVCAWAIVGLASVSAAAAPKQLGFASPQEGAAALAQAVQADNEAALRSILGRQGSKLVRSGDAVADARNRETFVQAFGETNKIVLEGSNHAQLWVGEQSWPMPIPLVKSDDGKWRFDTRSGEMEVLSRRIGANELAAIQVCLAVVDAEREFAARDSDGDGLREYASRLVSRPGQRDGLYWPTRPDEPLSPLGPLLAAAASDGYLSPGSGSAEPYHGYFYKILTSQGSDAAGGAYHYVVNGQMIAGFAVLAYPARHGASGIMTFMVGQDGGVYQKNLGRKTAVLAKVLTTFNPDASWTPVRDAR